MAERLVAKAVLDWDGGHLEPGDDASGVPQESVEWLVAQGLVASEEAAQ